MLLVLLAAGIPCLVGPAPANRCAEEIRLEELEKVPAPGVRWGVRGENTASATRAPWVDSNGWRFLRHPAGKYLYEVPRGASPLAVAEAFAYGVDARMRIDAGDGKAFGEMLAFLKDLGEAPAFVPAANIAVVDNGSPLLPEALNLLVRRNLLFRVVSAPDPKADLNVTIDSEAADPVAFAAKVRTRLTDSKRLLRIYGSEVVLGRLLLGAGRARIHLLNYGGEKVEGVRLRVRGTYAVGRLAVFGYDGAKPEDYLTEGGATEFTIPEMGIYTVVDLKNAP